ncbi:hypothetical protein OFS03_10705 [Brachyspira hyodysenteriae]|nr:hypothetical protein [Brachyspira hyodysenteriae]MDA0063674.1 hypothetical protein [Brachyspira hyodysenteriae]
MRELNFIEDNGLFGITFKSDDKEEANTIMNAIQRFISKVSKKKQKKILIITVNILKKTIQDILWMDLVKMYI